MSNDFIESILDQLNEDEFCSCDRQVVELIPGFRTYQCRSCGRPIRGSRNNTKEKHS